MQRRFAVAALYSWVRPVRQQQLDHRLVAIHHGMLQWVIPTSGIHFCFVLQKESRHGKTSFGGGVRQRWYAGCTARIDQVRAALDDLCKPLNLLRLVIGHGHAIASIHAAFCT
jgi:hypothetical protein